jgi:hypothetical protein
MTPIHRSKAAVCLSALLLLGGCAADKGCTDQNLVVSAPTYSAALYPTCNGQRVRVTARFQTHGSRVEALRVVATSAEGVPRTEPPTVQVVSGAAIQAQTTDGGATVLWFVPPGPCDGTCVTMIVTVPCTDRCPYRVRLVPVLKAG